MSRHVFQVRLKEMITIFAAHGKIELFIPASHSLKERRRIVTSVKSSLQNKFNISVIDSSEDNVWQRATLGVALVSLNYSGLHETMDAIDRHLGNNPDFEVIEFTYGYLPANSESRSP